MSSTDNEHPCPACESSFSSESALRDHQRDTGHTEPADSFGLEVPWGKLWSATWRIALVGAVIAGLAYPVMAPSFNEPRYPTTDDDWNAAYTIELCGKEQPPMRRSPGGIHTPGNGRIHIHPTTPSGAGKAANLERFFRNAGGYLQNDAISLPSGERYRNGDTCPDSSEPGYLGVFESGGFFGDDRRIPDPASYVPRDGDVIRIVFGPSISPPPDSAAGGPS